VTRLAPPSGTDGRLRRTARTSSRWLSYRIGLCGPRVEDLGAALDVLEPIGDDVEMTELVAQHPLLDPPDARSSSSRCRPRGLVEQPRLQRGPGWIDQRFVRGDVLLSIDAISA